MVHEGDTYFERCYGADFDVRVPQEKKELCWQAWLAHYTKHQPAHRVDYALGRIEALQSGEPAPFLPGLVRGALTPGELRSELDAAVSAASNTGSLLLAPISAPDASSVPNGCSDFCSEYERRCNADCPTANEVCTAGCQRERAICLNGCH
jgi:hypothetical protein